MQIIFFMGMPGSGKGTQAHLLAERLDFFHFETSKVIRNKFKEMPDDPEVMRVKEQYYGGKWIEPSVIVRWVKEALEDVSRDTSIVFDGSPRTVYEAKEIVPFLKNLYKDARVKTFSLTLLEEEALSRSLNRLICDICGYVVKPKDLENVAVGDECPKKGCKGKIIKRELDNPEIFARRLKEHKERTQPVLSYLESETEFHEIDAAPAVEEIHKSITQYL